MTELSEDKIECSGVNCTPKRELEKSIKELDEQKQLVTDLIKKQNEIRLMLSKKEKVEGNDKMVKENLELSNENVIVKNELDKFKGDNQNLELSVETLKKNLKSLQEELEGIKTDYEKREDIRQLDNEITTKEKEKKKIEFETRQLTKFKDKLKVALVQDKKDHEAIVKVYNEEYTKKKDLNKEVKILNLQISRLRKGVNFFKKKKLIKEKKKLNLKFNFNISEKIRNFGKFKIFLIVCMLGLVGFVIAILTGWNPT